MLNKIVNYFASRHILTNLIFVLVFLGGIFSWTQIKREEMPDITFDRVRISANYPGATAKEVEHFVTRELEEAVSGLDGVYRITSTASQGSTTVTVELEQNYQKKDEAITEIRNAVLDVKLPDDVRDEPNVRVFKTSKKAIIDIALIYKEKHLLDIPSRKLLQQYATSLENQLRNLPEINSLNRSGFFQEEIQINVDPQKLIKYNIPLSKVQKVVSDGHSRMPAGHIEIKNEPKVTINAQLDTIEKLNNVYVQAGFEGQAIALADVADVMHGFDAKKDIIKVNGYEAIMFNAVKNSSAGILEAVDAVKQCVQDFKANYLRDIPIDVVLLDDESIDVRNRLSIISVNGIIGFILILIMLFLFLNKKAGLWVGLGIPFTFCFTLICSLFFGYTINNITLAAVIIVMGMVVDDAIVVAENISRERLSGLSLKQASVTGTVQVFLPVLASIVTTCIAFIPLYFFSGRFGMLNRYIPPIIFLMLGASLFESLIILPGHMSFELPFFKKKNNEKNSIHWFSKVEDKYGYILTKILNYKYIVFFGFLILLIISGYLMKEKMQFVMFPHEETREIVVSGYANKEFDRYETANLTKNIEDLIVPYIGKEVVGFRTQIAKSRRGGAVEENRFRMIIEIVPKEKRDKSADDLVKLWKPSIEELKDLDKVVVQKSRWGHSSGSAVEIIIQENNDKQRNEATDNLAKLMKEYNALKNVEIDRPIEIPEYEISFKREKVKRLAINPADIASTFRAALEGKILYELPNGDEEVDVRLSVVSGAKIDIEKILDIPVENNQNYLVPMRDIVNIKNATTPNSISRYNERRVTKVFADIDQIFGKTPLKIAEYLEKEIFPKVTRNYPGITISFEGEIYDTRQSKGDFRNAIILVLFLIFAILAVLFNSLLKPLIVMLAIPCGMVGVILAFLLHGKVLFGFFAGIGCLGLAGVVVNDAIVMLTKLDSFFCKKEEKDKLKNKNEIDTKIARIAQTRLRAVLLTTVTTVSGVLPTAYGLAGYDAMLAEMMLALAWGLVFATVITLLLVPCLYSLILGWKVK